MKVFFNALIVHLVFNLYVFIRGWKVLPEKKRYRIPYASLFVVELIIYLVGYIANVSLPTEILRPIMLLGTSWMVLIGYLSAFLLTYDAILLLGKRTRRIRSLGLSNLRKKRIYFTSSLLVVILMMVYGNYRFYHPVVNEYNLTINKSAKNIDSLRIVMVSDVHLGYMIDKKILNLYVDKIMEQKPDMILMVGDIIDYDLPPLVEQKMEEEFLRLKAPLGVYVSTGNHEYRLNSDEKIAWLAKKTGMIMLRDEAIKINDSFYLIGREDDQQLSRKPLTDIMENMDRNYPVIVMNHEPNNLAEESNAGVDLAVYGHTHNGQLFPYNIVINRVYEVGHGYKKKDNTHIYVSSGLGLAGPQYRIGTISEIVVLNLKFKN